MEHRLKCWPEYYMPIIAGRKNFDLRRDDRDFQVGDEIILEEWSPARQQYMGSSHRRTICYILRDFEGLMPGYCILGLE